MFFFIWNIHPLPIAKFFLEYPSPTPYQLFLEFNVKFYLTNINIHVYMI